MADRSVTYPAATREDHLRFCTREGWEEVRAAAGGRVRHHLTYVLHCIDGQVLRTRISRPPGRQTYGTSVWAHILRDQLDVDEAAFWACVRDGVLPDRGEAKAPPRGIPADLYHLLTVRAGLPETVVRRMTRDEAITAAQLYWTEGG